MSVALEAKHTRSIHGRKLHEGWMEVDGGWLVFVKFKDRSEPINSDLGMRVYTHYMPVQTHRIL